MLLDPLELIEKVAVLVPAPSVRLLSYHGVLAPHAAWRALLVPCPSEGVDQETRPGMAGAPAGPLPGASPPADEPVRLGWAAFLKRVFAFEALHCPRCGGRRRIVAVHARPETLRPPLARLGLNVPPAASRASRSPPAPTA